MTAASSFEARASVAGTTPGFAATRAVVTITSQAVELRAENGGELHVPFHAVTALRAAFWDSRYGGAHRYINLETRDHGRVTLNLTGRQYANGGHQDALAYGTAVRALAEALLARGVPITTGGTWPGFVLLLSPWIATILVAASWLACTAMDGDPRWSFIVPILVPASFLLVIGLNWRLYIPLPVLALPDIERALPGCR